VNSDYFDLLLNLPNQSPTTLLSAFLLVFMRLTPIVAQAPFFGAKIVPATARAVLIFFLSFMLLPTALVYAARPIPYDGIFIVLALKELLIGFIIGYIVSIPFYVVQSTGILIDFMRGSSMMMAQDPSMQSQSSPIGILYNYTLITLFYFLGGPFYFFNGIIESLQFIPIDGFINPEVMHITNGFWAFAITIPHKVFSLAIQFAAPSILAVLMAEFFLGIANRLAPQVQIAFLGMSLKSLLGLGLLFAAWFFVLRQMSHFSIDWIEHISGYIRLLGRH
jgi:type III secretion protein T